VIKRGNIFGIMEIKIILNDLNIHAINREIRTIALGGLVSVTLLLAMVSNLLLLPSLLLTFERKIANKKIFKEPAIEIIPKEDDNGNS